MQTAFATPQQAARMAAFHVRRVSRFPRRLSSVAKVERYLDIVSRAQRLFCRGGWIETHHGRKPSRYTRVERMAWDKYCRNNPVIS